MPSYEQMKSEILHLSKTCEQIRPATTDDVIYRSFINAPKLDPNDIDEGMYWSVNKTMDAVFGADVVNKHVFTGPYGVELVMKWTDKAREHETWDKSSDQLLKLKLKRIRTYLISSNATKNNSKGKKRRGVSQPSSDVDSTIISNINKPAAKRQQTAAPSEVLVISSESDNNENYQPGRSSSKFSINNTSKPETSTKVSKLLDVLRLCPLSKDNKPCTRCRVEHGVLGDKDFWCHCSNKRLVLRHGRVETAEEHWKSSK
ncbi:uncharacterized protein MELLADRAFT_109853 [Melampsora larici-populina 98AG31]|uniref:Uncharacterized protein n=1 Tax=Melampsora larici-populina (strain 98AG31 / pathotype 3-4-7) TaxID=747676 RepID=F4RXU8_MELLP|nr:uncharacterized protein MELLADRAFT_109853 [Melampsora larici-populina 98AG31]EGG02836.1 hypothetical protein MELLADRAFT_109853 [Melampsora larici-populina 98AG31]